MGPADSLRPLLRPARRGAELHGEIARHIGAYRGVRCHPDQILVTAGTTQAIGIVSRLLVQDRRTACLLEDPIISVIQRIVTGLGGRITPVSIDEHGMVTEALPPAARPAFIYVTPSHQFPIGATMPIRRRARMLQHARARGGRRWSTCCVGSMQGEPKD